MALSGRGSDAGSKHADATRESGASAAGQPVPGRDDAGDGAESEPDSQPEYGPEARLDEAAAEDHRATPHFAKYAVGGLYQHMLERNVENLTAIA